MKAILMLEDGTAFSGEALGEPKEKIGEVILNTAVVGYQEMMTDPVNAGKILVLTYPLIGNYGTAPKFNESSQCWVSGLVIKEKSNIYSNWQAKSSLDEFVKQQGVFLLSGVDTRTLAVHLRDNGEMLGIISIDLDRDVLLGRIKAYREKSPEDYLKEISQKKPLLRGNAKSKYKVAVLDLGVTESVLKQLEALGFSVIVLPYNTTAQEIIKLKPRGLIISNGPESSLALKEVVANIKELIGKIPILGISTGHQMLAAALGAKIVKMKLGHRGVNYPILNPVSSKAEITAQNHGQVVDSVSLEKIRSVKITGRNLNDHSVEEMKSAKYKIIGVQYSPVSPGLNEVNGVFKKFMKLIKES